MAPMEHIPHASMQKAGRRKSLMMDVTLRRRNPAGDDADNDRRGRGGKNGRRKDGDGGDGDGNGDGDSNGRGRGGRGNGDGNGDDNGDDNGDGGDGDDGDSSDGPRRGKSKNKKGGGDSSGPSPPTIESTPPQPEAIPTPSEPTPALAPIPSAPASVSETPPAIASPPAAAPNPNTIVVTTTMPPTSTSSSTELPPPESSSSSLPALLSSISTTPIIIPTMFPTTVAPGPTALPITSPAADTSSQPRKGVDGNNLPETESKSWTRTRPFRPGSTMTETVMVTPQSVLAPAPTDLPDIGPNKNQGPNPDRFRRPPPRKSDQLSPTAERLLIAAGAIGGFIIIMAGVYLLMRMKNKDMFGKARNRSVRKGGKRGFYGWRRNQRAPLEAPPDYDDGRYVDEKKVQEPGQYDGAFAPAISPAVLPPLTIPETTNFNRAESPNSTQSLTRGAAPFGYSPRESPISDPQPSFNNTGRRNTLLARRASNANDTMVTQTTQPTFISQQTSNLRPTNQAQTSRISYISSLSSGFGDGLIIPDTSNPTAPMQGYRQSRPPGTFSWQQGNRDTVYTTTSEDTAPRFRTINSWVAQQAGRMDAVGQTQPDQNIPSVPSIPVQLQAGQISSAQPIHQRSTSEDPVFKFHPGDEVQISRGSRVPSEILNRKTGIN